jgi:hypothetical protein
MPFLGTLSKRLLLEDYAKKNNWVHWEGVRAYKCARPGGQNGDPSYVIWEVSDRLLAVPCRTTVMSELLTRSPPLYLMKPSFLNLFMK